MGILRIQKGKDEYWTDATQNVVDAYLEKIGFDYNKKDHTKEELKKFYNRAVRNKTLFKNFTKEYYEQLKRKPLKNEFKYHITMALESGSHPYKNLFSKKKR